MALEKVVWDDKVEVVGEFRSVQIRQVTQVLEDGVVLSESFSRRAYDCCSPDGSGGWVPTDVSGETQEVQNVCNGVWNQVIRDAFIANAGASPQ